MNTVNVYLAEGFEEIEALAVVDILRRADIKTNLISISNDIEVIGAHQIAVKADYLIESFDNYAADLLFLPGGMPGTKKLENCAALEEIILQYSRQSKPLAAICAAPRILGNLGLLEGKDATCYPGNEAFLKNAKISPDKVVVSGSILTAKGAGAAVDFGLKIVEFLSGKSKSDSIRTSIIAD